MSKIFSIAWYEAKMSSRSWRFWLLLTLIAGVSWFARQDFLEVVRGGMFVHTAYSFAHPSFWLMFSVIMLGAASLGLDICGRLRNNGMDKIMFPLPFSSMQLMWGRFLGVLFIMLPLSALGVFSLAVWHYFYGHGFVIWQPFVYAYLYLILPCMIPVIVTAITMRTFFKHDFAALLFGAVFMLAVMIVGQKTGVILDVPEVMNRLRDSSPTIGVRLNWRNHTGAFWVHGLYSLFVLYLGPLYLRRQQIQTWGAAAGDRFGFSRLLGHLSRFRIDRNLEMSYRIALIVLIGVCTVGGIRAGQHYQDILEQERLEESYQRMIVTETNLNMPVDIASYKIDMLPLKKNRLPLHAAMQFELKGDTEQLVFELEPTYELDSVALNGQKVPFERRLDRIYIQSPSTIQPEDQVEVSFAYAWNEPRISHEYGVLLGRWYPVPARRIQASDNNPYLDREQDLFDAAVTVHLAHGQNSVFAGELIRDEETNGGRVEEWRTKYPVNHLELRWGLYDKVTVARDYYRIHFYHLPYHAYESQVMLEEVQDQEEYVTERLGVFPFEDLVLVETPYDEDEFTHNRWWNQHATPENQQPRMPGMIRMPEELLSYMHEGIWSLERLDTDPREVPFYQMLRSTVYTVRDSFYKNYIKAYFEDAFHPTGELAFWLEEYLYSYAAKLLEQNRWVQKQGLNFNIGTSKDKPVHAAKEKSLVELHREGDYKELERVRGEGTLRMIHHLLGDDEWWAVIKNMFEDNRFKEMPVKELFRQVEERYGEPLDWFVEQWVYGSVLPEYQVVQAEGKILEEQSGEDEFRVYYEASIKVKNHGTGRMAVPVFIETEMDYIFRDLWLDSQDEQTLTLTMPSRPLFATVDPENWVVKTPYYDPNLKRRINSEMKVYIPGDDRKNVGRGFEERGRRGRGRRGGFRFGF